MNQKKCFKDIYAPYKWTMLIALLVQTAYGGFMTLGIYTEWMRIALPVTAAVLLIVAHIGRTRRAARIAVRVITALPIALSVLMLLFQTAVSAANGWQLSFGTILWDAVRSTLPTLPWLLPALGIAAYDRTRYDRTALCVAQGFTTALTVTAVVLALLPESGIITANPWGIPHIAALGALAGVCAAVLAITLIYSAAHPARRAADVEDGTDTFDGMYKELEGK